MCNFYIFLKKGCRTKKYPGIFSTQLWKIFLRFCCRHTKNSYLASVVFCLFFQKNIFLILIFLSLNNSFYFLSEDIPSTGSVIPVILIDCLKFYLLEENFVGWKYPFCEYKIISFYTIKKLLFAKSYS